MIHTYTVVAAGVGTVTESTGVNTWVNVVWDAGGSNYYRWGAEYAYDLEIVPGEPLVDLQVQLASVLDVALITIPIQISFCTGM
jgi:hypothetical protein